MSCLTHPTDRLMENIARSPSTDELLQRLEIPSGKENLITFQPFGAGDTTCGVENEFQALVEGRAEDVDLACMIRESNFYQNILKRSLSGDVEPEQAEAITNLVRDTGNSIWENSWVRFPENRLSAYALHLFHTDLRADKKKSDSPLRSDAHQFVFIHNQETWIRVPVSYLLKLSLADIIGRSPNMHPILKVTASRMMDHFVSDNTSPEVLSFHPVHISSGKGAADALTGETLKRFLLCQLLLEHANETLGLLETGQKAALYFASHPPLRQKALNDMISDGFYRELFMNPCLSGWDQGESKKRYMGLCHEVLSRSQLNAVKKLKECGIITRNLVVLPNTSNICLANNGTHISIGSRRLTRLMANPTTALGQRDEKWMGDFITKITEHFLPLFVGTYSATPYRLEFEDFHPEQVLGFLPHELDFTHLRMIWRRWKKKAKNHIAGRSLTPFGPPWLDKNIRRLFRFKGDLVPDFRLLDYPVALLSTPSSPALDGSPGNQELLLKDLGDSGAFDPRMSMYLPYRIRPFHKMGFSGFEGRLYSTFPSIGHDMGKAARLQTLITALGFQYLLSGRYGHADIPDTPFVESERRQVMFAAAIGLPTVYFRSDTPNLFLKDLFPLIQGTRMSRRYPGYLRIPVTSLMTAFHEKIMQDGAALIEAHGAADLMEDLRMRLVHPGFSASARLQTLIQKETGGKRPEKQPAEVFNRAAETCYRTRLKEAHIREAVRYFAEDLSRLENWALFRDAASKDALASITRKGSISGIITSLNRRQGISLFTSGERLSLIQLLILSTYNDKKHFEASP
ncbi:hypothetical protein OOT00_05250 [Desulfobotulus sp. H1]|uniref:Uncharacterized protein n=1 Tax=Desulfobotulus pelophilus TaxID=2823377 RepID=A0ABT3N892_9BACT|nr:hypothetical protein [Desulfobotulus pelophilus]MCW7753391.1 hypothetical protein [Desulfobotulus pelophilus]